MLGISLSSDGDGISDFFLFASRDFASSNFLFTPLRQQRASSAAKIGLTTCTCRVVRISARECPNGINQREIRHRWASTRRHLDRCDKISTISPAIIFQRSRRVHTVSVSECALIKIADNVGPEKYCGNRGESRYRPAIVTICVSATRRTAAVLLSPLLISAYQLSNRAVMEIDNK